ncbi:MAG: class II aldolase/adducin family protein [Acidimicrobiia bacterium]|nr:class II aldolase/adducin family protein [Acidimicrobiia bacterium]
MDEERAARAALVSAAQRLDELGLNHNSSGNAGVRIGAGVLVTPSGIPAHELTPDDMVLLDDAGEPRHRGQRRPTSEWQLHVEVLLRRPEVVGIAHIHSLEATAAATVGQSLPPIHYVAARFGGTFLTCAPYATYGTAELATLVADTLGSQTMACLMANHGAIALGPDLDTAVALALDVEWFCGVVRRARQQGEPIVLADDEMARVAELFRSYGQPSA